MKPEWRTLTPQEVIKILNDMNMAERREVFSAFCPECHTSMDLPVS